MAHFRFNGNSKQALYHPYRKVDKMINNKDTVSRAIEERKMGERDKSSRVIQSHYRAHVVRCKLKEELKEEIDVEIKSVESIQKLFCLITKFFYAYRSEIKYGNGYDCYSRLLLISSQMLKNADEIGKEIMKNMINDKISMICMVTSIKKVLELCIRFISNNASQQDVSMDVPLQMIRDFTCLNTYLRGQSSDEVKDHASVIVDYLFNNDYYSAIKSLIENRLQIITDESQNGFVNDILLFDNIIYLKKNMRSAAYQRMILELFVQPLKYESKKYLLMNLNNPSFPYMEMLESLSLIIQLEQLTSAQILNLFHCLLKLAKPHYDYLADNTNIKSSFKPFDSLLDISSGALTIVDCCLKMYFMICTSYTNNAEFRKVFKEATHLIICLYDLDNKIKFMNGKIWAVHSLPQLILPPTKTCKLKEEEYAASRDRLMIILEELPFVYTLESKLESFIYDTMSNVHEYSLELYAQVDAIVLLRSNHVYEDAFQIIRIDKKVDLSKFNRFGFTQNICGYQDIYYRDLKGFLNLVMKTGFNPSIGLFKETSERFLYPDPLSEFSKEDYLEHYYFLGMILGTAIIENKIFNLPFASFFLIKLLGKDSDELNFHHMSSLDPVLYKNLLCLRDTDDVESMELYFNLEYDVQGSLKTVDLKPNGSSILVDNNNKHEYITLFADWHLNKRIRKHCIAFKNGLHSITGFDNLRIFDDKELQFLISGANAPIDIEDLKKHTEHFFKPNSLYSEVIENFWSVVGEMTETQKGDLLNFVTGSRIPPPFGFKTLRPSFKISFGRQSSRLPTSTTCFNMLRLETYEDKEILKERLLKAITPGFEESM